MDSTLLTSAEDLYPAEWDFLTLWQVCGKSSIILTRLLGFFPKYKCIKRRKSLNGNSEVYPTCKLPRVDQKLNIL